MRDIVHRMSWTLASAAAVGVATIMVLTVTDVARRTTTGRAFPGTVDLSELTMVVVVFLALGLTQRDRQHVAVSLVTIRLPESVARWCRIVGLVVAIALVAWLCIAAAQVAWRSYDRNEFRFGLLRVVVWPARAMIPVGCLALVLELGMRVVDLVCNTDLDGVSTAATDGTAGTASGVAPGVRL